MICANCGNQNEATHKFCSECGAQLSAVCPDCGHANPPGHKFCSECGTALQPAAAEGENAEPAGAAPAATPSAPVAEERRLVTALFADLVGFTPLSENRDPEEVRALLTTYFDRSREVIERFGGVVDKFIGDAVTAFWGATVAQEDDAERAVRAALELVGMAADLGSEIDVPDLALRAGVLTGETAVGPGGNEKGLVVGDVVNTASRLQSVAAPGTVLVGDSTYRLTQEAVSYEPVGEQQLKGKSLPVRAWRCLNVIAERGGRGRAEGLEAPFVGRDEELRMLKDVLHATAREGRSRLISVVGEGGIGKSRLAWEFQKYVDGLVEDVYWHQGRSPAYGEGVTFWALSEMVKRRAGIADTDDGHKSRTKLRTAVAEYVPGPDDQRWIEPRLAGLLGVESMPAGDRTELFAALRTFFQRVSDLGTTVLVFDDFHWSDSGLLEFIEELVERSPRHPILVITLARPELLDREPGWGSGRQGFYSVHLGPLSDAAMTELVAGLVPGIPDNAVDLVTAQAGGVPLYAVEFVRMLVTEGDVVRDDGHFRLVGDLTDLAVPDTLHAVIGARLDRLESEDRALLQDAAVLGLAFTVDGLALLRSEESAALQERLRGLVRSELLQFESDPRSPERGQYRFVQSLIREVAYGRLTKPERRNRHVQVARYFESLEDIELAALVASHYVDAYRSSPDGPEADELAGRAYGALCDAAQRAEDLHSYEQALALTEQALDIIDSPRERAELWELAARSANGLMREESAVGFARQALDWHENQGDESGAIRTATLLGKILSDNNRNKEAIGVLEPVFNQKKGHDGPGLPPLAAGLARAFMIVGRSEEAADIADVALFAAEQQEDIPVLVEAMNTRGTALANLGRVREGTALLKGALELAEGFDLPVSALRASNNLGVVLQADDPRSSVQLAELALEKARRIGEPHYLLQFTFRMVWILTASGRFDEALAMMDEHEEEYLPDWWRHAFRWTREAIGLFRGEPGAVDRGRDVLAYWDDPPDPQIRAIAATWRAVTHVYERDWARAFDVAMTVDTTSLVGTDSLELAAIASIWLGDAERMTQVSERWEGVRARGRAIRAIQHLVEAAAAALEDRRQEAVAGFKKAVAILRQVGMPQQMAQAQLMFAAAVGLDHPDALAAAEAAYEWAVSCGAQGFIDTFAEAMPPAAKAGAATG